MKPTGPILPIALMALGIVAFLLFIDLSISPKKATISTGQHNTNATTNIHQSNANTAVANKNISSNTNSSNSSFCQSDADCAGPVCRRCYNQDFVKNWRVRPLCADYLGDSCRCQAHVCTLVTTSVNTTVPQ